MSTSTSAVPQKLFADIYGYELSPFVLRVELTPEVRPSIYIHPV